MKVAQLREALLRCARALSEEGDEEAAMGVRKLSELLKPHDTRSWSDVIADLRRLLPTRPEVVPPQTAYADRLQAAASTGAPIDSLLKELETNRKLKNHELFILASGFLGAQTKFKSRKDAIRAIRQRHIERIQDKRNVATIEKLTTRR
jgi:hypothetical protein